jgi:hypothetical protein
MMPIKYSMEYAESLPHTKEYLNELTNSRSTCNIFLSQQKPETP